MELISGDESGVEYRSVGTHMKAYRFFYKVIITRLKSGLNTSKQSYYVSPGSSFPT